jgi:membrane dipeptidase
MPLRPGDESFLPQLERARKTGVSAISLNIGFGDQSVEAHLRMLAHFRHWLARHPEQYILGASAEDVRRAEREGKLAVFFDIEGAGGIDDQLSLISMYYELGVRWMLLAYNVANRVGGGCYEEDEGLTEFGREVVREMNRVGMVICCSHTGERTAAQVLELSCDPVIFSHSNAEAITDHPRNISDRLICACAESGGVIGINGLGPFLGSEDSSIEAFVRHVDHMVQLVGPDHVGIGLDYVYDRKELEDYLASMKGKLPRHPETISFVEPERIPQIAEALHRRGYDERAVAQIMGGNWFRIAEQIWN